MNKELPFFKYHPNIYKQNYFETSENICKCCGNKTTMWTEWMYTAEDDVDCICVHCIHDGSASKKFNGDFVDFVEPGVEDDTKTDEILHRTPGYVSLQGERWQTCCEDYCIYLGPTDCEELNNLNISDDVIQECSEREGFNINKEDIQIDGGCFGLLNGYLFQCSHCGKYYLVVDYD